MSEAQHACGYCGNPAEEGHLCRICDATTVRALTLLAPIVADLQALMANIRAVPTDRIRVDSSREHQLPPLEYGDRAHRVYAVVADWSVSWAGVVGSGGPAHLRGYDPRNRVQRLPSSWAGFTVASQVSNWLIAHHDQIKLHPDAPRYALDVTEAIAREARFLGYRPTQRRVRGKRCRSCDSPTLKMAWPIDGEPRLRCTACGEVWECGPQLTMMTLKSA